MAFERGELRLSAGFRSRRAGAILAIGLLMAELPGRGAFAQGAPSLPGVSRQMSIAIDFYERGKDLEAMDRFMEILVQGNPSERPMANEYLNMISQRMAIGGKFEGPPAAPPAATVIEDAAPRGRSSAEPPREAPPAALPGRFPERPPRAAEREPSPARSQGQLSKSDRELMQREIEGKIRNRTRVLLSQLQKFEDIRVRMANSRLPRAIGIPAELLFDSGTQFKKESGTILKLLGHLVFSLGATQVVILPERAVLGDSKIIDMRRTMGISSHLITAGVAPARIRVNLLSSQVAIPRDLQDFQGILLVFVYNQPLELTADSAVDAAAGPPLSLGVSPEDLDPVQGEGLIIEFSVLEPPGGLMSWRFQLMAPGRAAGDDLVPLQEVKGSAPVFHQIFWNARERYFGRPLPGGRYEAVLTATDMGNRTRKKHAWVTVRGPRPAPAPSPPETDKPEPPPADLPGAPREETKPIEGRTLAKQNASRRRRPRARKNRKPPVSVASKTILPEPSAATTPEPKEESRPAGEEEAPARRTGAVNYQVLFQKNSPNITPDGENILGRVADTMHYYPLDNINLVGYAYTQEPDPEGLALRRAELVKSLLVERHGMKGDRIQPQSKVVDREAPKVEIYIVAGSQ